MSTTRSLLLRSVDAQRALSLEFAAETSFEEIIRVYLEDELGH